MEPFGRANAAMSASHRRAADSTSVLSTLLRSNVERLMTLSTSAVAVCCCSDSRSSLSSRVFSMAMTVCFEHRHVDDCAGTSEVGDSDDRWIAFKVRRLRPKILGVRYLLRPGDMSKTGLRMRAERLAKTNISILRRYVVERDVTKCFSIVQAQRAELGVAEPCCVRQHSIENRLQLAGRACDDAQHIRGRSLLLKRLAQLVEQAGVLDGDDGLGSKILQQFDLFVGKRPDFLPVDENNADHHIVLDHWHANSI